MSGKPFSSLVGFSPTVMGFLALKSNKGKQTNKQNHHEEYFLYHSYNFNLGAVTQ